MNFPNFFQRMFWLFVLGLLNAFIFHIDILRDFAVVGILLFFTTYLNKKQLLIFSIILTFFIPFLRAYTEGLGFERMDLVREITPLYRSNNLWEVMKYNWEYIRIVQIQNPVYLISVHYEMFCFFLGGVVASRWKIFEDENLLWKIAKKTLIFSLIGIFIIWILRFIDKDVLLKINSIYDLKISMEILFASLVLAFVTMIYLSGILKKIFHYIEIYGRMTLTNYLIQSVFALFIFSGFGLGLGGNQPGWTYFLIAVFVYLLQLIISFHWSKKFQLGPVEWLWRSLSARRILPLKKSA